MPWILSCPWLLQCSSLALFPAHYPVAASAAVVEPMEEDKEEEGNDEVDVEQGSSTIDPVPNQTSAEVEKEVVLAQEDSAMAE